MGSFRLIIFPALLVLHYNGVVQGKSLTPGAWRSSQGVKVCETEECKQTAEMFRSSINFSVDPCEDFYAYACGNWMKNNPIPPTSTRMSQFNLVDDKLNQDIQEILRSPTDEADGKPLNQVKMFYKACQDTNAMNDRGLEPLAKVVKHFGGLPLLEQNDWKKGEFALQKTMSQLNGKFGIFLLMAVTVSPDVKDTNRRIIYIDQPEFSLPRDVLLHQEKFTERMDAYRKFMKDVMLELNQFKNKESSSSSSSSSSINSDYLDKKVEEIIQFETQLANVSAKAEDRVVVDKIYNSMTLKELPNFSQINWSDFLNEIFEDTGVNLAQDERLIVLQPEYLQKASEVVANTPIEVIVNYIQWRIVSSLVVDTTDRMREIEFEFAKAITGLREPLKREKTCADVDINSEIYMLGFAIGAKYIEKNFLPQAKDDVNDMVAYLRTAFKELLSQAEWMDEATKGKAFEKIQKMSQFMAYPEWLQNKTAVEEFFNGLEFTRENHLQNRINLLRWQTKKMLKSLREPTDRNDMDSHPVYVNAQYSPEMNSITFPAGILAAPFYRNKGPASVNFGGIGVVIGHEVTHGFDNQGSQYDEVGNAKDWWSASVKEEFNAKAQCMIDQYGNFETPYGKVNGLLTVGENIADNGGLRQSFLAYKNWIREKNGGQEEARLPGLEDLTPEQLFFLGYSNVWCQNVSPQAAQTLLILDPHSPGKFRVFGPLMNSDNFAKAWNCPENSYMNPKNKCTLW